MNPRGTIAKVRIASGRVRPTPEPRAPRPKPIRRPKGFDAVLPKVREFQSSPIVERMKVAEKRIADRKAAEKAAAEKAKKGELT